MVVFVSRASTNFYENKNFTFEKEIQGLATVYSKIRDLIANDENWSIGYEYETKREKKRGRGSLNPTLIRNNRNVYRYPVENARARSRKEKKIVNG